MKKFLAMLLVLAMMATLFAACGDAKDPNPSTQDTTPSTQPSETDPVVVHPTDPLEMITDGYYTYHYTAEGYGDFTYFFRFYEEDPVLGSVFYAGLLNNGAPFAGLYTVEEVECAYECYPDREAASTEGGQMVSGTAPYTVSFYDWNGNLLDQCAYDGNILYNDLEAISAMASGPVMYHHDIEGENSKHTEIYAAEMGVPYLEFVGVEDDLATVSLAHNRTYVDLVGMIVEGNWQIATNADGGYDYTLVNDEGVTDAVLSVSADAKTAVYTKADGSLTLNMVNAAPEVIEEAARYSGSMPTNYGADATVTMILYVDNTVKISIDIFGNVADLDAGTYAIAEDGTITFNFTNAGDIKNEGNTVHYVLANEGMPVDVVLTKEGAEAFLVLTGEGGMAAYEGFTFPENLTLYTDGTCELSVEIQGEVTVLATGTYTLNEYGIPAAATLEGIGDITITIDYTTLLLSAEIPAIESAGFNATTVSVSLSY